MSQQVIPMHKVVIDFEDERDASKCVRAIVYSMSAREKYEWLKIASIAIHEYEVTIPDYVACLGKAIDEELTKLHSDNPWLFEEHTGVHA